MWCVLVDEKSSYDSLLEYSTITVNFNSVEKESFFKDYFEYLGNFFVGLGKMVLYLLPIGFVGFGVVYCIIIIPFDSVFCCMQQ